MHRFERDKLLVKPLNERRHDLDMSAIMELKGHANIFGDAMANAAGDLLGAKKNGSASVLFMGGHVIRAGVQLFLIDLMKRGYIGCIAMNGACIIHDYEFARIGATTENVARYISEGQFGLWKETGEINDIINNAYAGNSSIGLGAAVGEYISGNDLPYKEISLLAAAKELGIPVTVHVGIGYDIIHEHPNFNGAATGALSYNDFLTLVSVISGLEGGVVMNFGSAVMAPEVFLKGLSMARNVAHQNAAVIKHFTTLVCDLYDLPDDISKEPEKDLSGYYFRPWKTMLVRTVADGGKSYYVKGGHKDTIPALWTLIDDLEKTGGTGNIG